MNLQDHLVRQMEFSASTFGPGERTKGVVDHISKELKEIVAETQPELRAAEWVDAVILSLNGLCRALATAYPSMTHAEIARKACEFIEDKQTRNEGRKWPDWRTIGSDRAIEHDRTGELPIAHRVSA